MCKRNTEKIIMYASVCVLEGDCTASRREGNEVEVRSCPDISRRFLLDNNVS